MLSWYDVIDGDDDVDDDDDGHVGSYGIDYLDDDSLVRIRNIGVARVIRATLIVVLMAVPTSTMMIKLMLLAMILIMTVLMIIAMLLLVLITICFW